MSTANPSNLTPGGSSPSSSSPTDLSTDGLNYSSAQGSSSSTSSPSVTESTASSPRGEQSHPFEEPLSNSSPATSLQEFGEDVRVPGREQEPEREIEVMSPPRVDQGGSVRHMPSQSNLAGQYGHTTPAFVTSIFPSSNNSTSTAHPPHLSGKVTPNYRGSGKSGTASDRRQSSGRVKKVSVSKKGSVGGVGGFAQDGQAAFLDFLWTLGRLVMSPITYPLSMIYSIISSPLTISLTLKAILMLVLLGLCGLSSIAMVMGFWVRYGGGVGLGHMGGKNVVEMDGWFVYGSKANPIPHSIIQFKPTQVFPDEDVVYDVEVEMELVRPTVKDMVGAGDGLGNFMIWLDILSEKTNKPIRTISQPCLPALPYTPAPLLSRLLTLLPIPRTPSSLFLPSLNPFKLLCSSTDNRLQHRPRERAAKDTYLLTRPMITGERDGLVIRPRRGGDRVVGGVKVSIGREDGFGGVAGSGSGKEVMTTGWVVVRFIERPRGVRWLFTSYPIIPLLILPPLALMMTLTSALTSYAIVSYCLRSSSSPRSGSSTRREASKSSSRLGVGNGSTAYSSSRGNGVTSLRDRSHGSVNKTKAFGPAAGSRITRKMSQNGHSILDSTGSDLTGSDTGEL